MNILKHIEIAYEYKVVRHGEVLFEAGEVTHSIFTLVNGRVRLEVPPHSEEGKRVFVQDVSKPGEIIGEFSLINGHTHHFYATAVRDSELVVFESEAFQHAVSERPEIVNEILATIEKRELEKDKKKKRNRKNMIAIIPAQKDREDLLREFTNKLVMQLSKIGSTRLIRSKLIEERFPKVTKTEDLIASRKIWYYIHSQEENYEFVVCIGDSDPSSVWTR